MAGLLVVLHHVLVHVAAAVDLTGGEGEEEQGEGEEGEGRGRGGKGRRGGEGEEGQWCLLESGSTVHSNQYVCGEHHEHNPTVALGCVHVPHSNRGRPRSPRHGRTPCTASLSPAPLQAPGGGQRPCDHSRHAARQQTWRSACKGREESRQHSRMLLHTGTRIPTTSIDCLSATAQEQQHTVDHYKTQRRPSQQNPALLNYNTTENWNVPTISTYVSCILQFSHDETVLAC